MPKLLVFPRIALLFISSFSFINVTSQSVINSTGNTIKDSTYYIEYSIGEISITTLENKSNNITQGLLQPNFKDQPAKAIVFIPNKNLLGLYLQHLKRAPFRSFRTTNYNYLCTIFSNRKYYL